MRTSLRHLIVALLATAAAIGSPALAAQQKYAPTDFRLELEIGEHGAGGSHVFHEIRGIGLDEADRIWVADLFNFSIRIFGPDGRLVREVGGVGDGPGEFRDIRALGFTNDGALVFDLSAERLTTFDRGGDLTDAQRLIVRDRELREWTSPWIPLKHDHFLTQGRAITGSMGGHPFNPQSSLLLVPESNAPRDTLATFFPNTIQYRWEGWPGFVNPVPVVTPPPGGSWAVSGDSLIATVDGTRGHVRLYRVTETGAEPAGSFDLGWEPRPVSEREVLSDAMRVLTVPSRHPGARMGEFTLYVPEFESRVGRIALEPDGRVWLKLQEWDASPQLNEDGRPLGVVPEEEEWLVVDPARGVVAEVRFPFGFRLQQVIGNRYLGIHVDEWEVESVHLYLGPVVGPMAPAPRES